MPAKSDLERRVDRLENEAVSIYDLVDEETTEIRRTLADHGRILADHGRILADHSQQFEQVHRTLAEIVRRLPEPQ